MPHQPTFPSPYMTDVDVEKTEDFTIQCLINPRDTVIAYDITIKCLDTFYNVLWENTVYHIRGYLSGGVEHKYLFYYSSAHGSNLTINLPTTNEIPISGGNGDNSWLTIKIPTTRLKEDKTIKKIMGNGQYCSWTIKLYTKMMYDKNNLPLWNSGGVEYIKSPEYFFRTRPNPVITFDVSRIISQCNINASATYSQEYTDYTLQLNSYTAAPTKSTPVAYHSFDLYHDGELIDSTGNIYSPHMNYSYNNLINGYDYTLKLTIVNDNGMEFVEERPFSVEYELYNTTAKPKVSFDEDKTCITINFKDNVVIAGKTTEDNNFNLVKFADSNGTTPETTNALCLDYNQSIFWNDKGDGIPLNLTDTYQILHWHGHPGYSGKIIEKIDDVNPANNISVWYDGAYFYYRMGLNDAVQICPVENGYDEPTTSAVFEGIVSEEDLNNFIEETKLYEIPDEAIIDDEDYLTSNDLTNKYWWHIIILNNEVKISKSTAYTDKVVSEA